ncbi:MAG TPA: bifunctional riboflavin kinase/FAD synthetase [Desulfobacterales bacterium]
MQVIRSLEEIEQPLQRAVLTVGNSDGVHLGHQALFHTVTEKAEAIGGTSVAMTFEPHPMKVIRPGYHPPLITLLEQKIELIERADLEVLVIVPFTRTFASLSPREFVEDVLIRKVGMAAMVVGSDYTFGKHRAGNVRQLRNFSELFDFELIVADWIQIVKENSKRISSTKIRELVTAGRVDKAPDLLGRYYQIRGRVTTGRDRGGKLLGFPTANINLQDELCPGSGIYAVTVERNDRIYDGVANIGYSPTFDDHLFTIEVHILDFDETIYGEKIRINFIQRIRDEKKFAGVTELSDQIRRDVEAARRILARTVHRVKQ